MLKITTISKAPGWAAQAIKEDLCMFLEKYGDSRVVEVEEVTLEQLEKEGTPWGK